MSAYSNIPWIEAVRNSGAKFVALEANPASRFGWSVFAAPEPAGWIGVRYLSVHAVERQLSCTAAHNLADRLNKGYNR